MLEKILDSIQSLLNFEYCTEKQYETRYGLGRTGFLGSVLGIICGLHAGFIVAMMCSTEPLSDFGRIWVRAIYFQGLC